MLTGTICYGGFVTDEFSPTRAQKVLEMYGIEVLGYDATEHEWKVRFSDAALKLLDPMWGLWVWSLTPKDYQTCAQIFRSRV